MKLITTNEAHRRKVNSEYDNEASYHHIYNFKFAEKYITNKIVLDIGCWTGQFEKLAVKATKKIVGIDPSKDAVALAKKNVPNAQFQTGNALKLSFKNSSFDCVTMLEVIEHLPKNTEDISIDEIYRVLKKKGYLVLSTPNKNIFSILLDPAYFIIGHRHYSLSELKKMLVSHNFKIVDERQTAGFVTLLTHLFELFLKHLFKISFKEPVWLKNAIENEYKNKGFSENHIIAQKIA